MPSASHGHTAAKVRSPVVTVKAAGPVANGFANAMPPVSSSTTARAAANSSSASRANSGGDPVSA